MKLRITGRHMNITSALRDYVETRFERLDRYGLKTGSLQVVLGVEKLQHKAEVVGTVNGKRVQAKTSTREMYATIDALVDRVDAQFRKWKERLVNHKPSKTKRSRVAEPRMKWQPEDFVGVERQAVPTLSIGEAQKQFIAESSNSPFLLFVNVANGKFHVMQRGVGGRPAVIEPYPEDGQLR
jgi:putative sigma-54 modulation protein